MTSARDPKLLDAVLTASPVDAWLAVFDKLYEVFSEPLTPQHVEREVADRERKVVELELLLSGSAWELWREFEASVPRTTKSLIEFWNTTPAGKAVLILDGLSLREMPWLLQEAKRRGYQIHQTAVRGSELHSDTTPFAKALGFSQRSALENNGAGLAHNLPGACTESTDAEWSSCLDWMAAAPAIVLWHHWPDDRIHKLAEPGDGFQKLCREAAEKLTSDSFWTMIERMTTGRRLVITSDHGYAASGMFHDVGSREQANWLKTNFGSSRFSYGPGTEHHWVPPISLCLTTEHGTNQFALGRRKWRSHGGYPTMAHGGLSLLEVTVPFIEISKTQQLMPPRTKGKSKKELLAEQIAAAVGAGREVAVETVDFSDPNRPKTCLEVDFPIIPINQIAGPEMSSGAAKKPIYAWQKCWARRSSAVFRGMLLASAIRAPEDESKSAKAVWDAFYANHQKRGALRHLKVADPFMGGGTTIVEGSRLGIQMFGCDLNPVAWFVVKNEMAQVDLAEVKRLLADIEAEVKPLIMPYYACDGTVAGAAELPLRRTRNHLHLLGETWPVPARGVRTS